MNFDGRYKLKSSENFDEYLKAVGVGFVLRKLATAATPTFEVISNGDDYVVKSHTTLRTVELKFKIGQEFDEVTPDGRSVKSVMLIEDNKLIHKQKGEVDSTITRIFDGKECKVVHEAKDVTCIRMYDKLE